MINKKSQAALEFIMTYGWAILVVLVAIAALAYFGVMSPDRYLPEKCTLQSGLACLDHRIEPAQITVRINNGNGYDISSVQAKVSRCDASAITNIPNGGVAVFTMICSPILTGNKYSGQLNLSYTRVEIDPSGQATGLPHLNIGEVTGRIQ